MNVDVAHPESGINSPCNRLTSVAAADRTSSDNTNLSSNGVSTFHAPLVNKKKKNGVILPPLQLVRIALVCSSNYLW